MRLHGALPRTYAWQSHQLPCHANGGLPPLPDNAGPIRHNVSRGKAPIGGPELVELNMLLHLRLQ